MEVRFADMRKAAHEADAAQVYSDAARLTVEDLRDGLHQATIKAAKAKEILAIVKGAELDLSNALLIEAELKERLKLVRRKIKDAERKANKKPEAERLAVETQKTAGTLAEALKRATETAASAARSATEAGERFAGVATATLTGYKAATSRRDTRRN